MIKYTISKDPKSSTPEQVHLGVVQCGIRVVMGRATVGGAAQDSAQFKNQKAAPVRSGGHGRPFGPEDVLTRQLVGLAKGQLAEQRVGWTEFSAVTSCWPSLNRLERPHECTKRLETHREASSNPDL